MQFSYHSFTTSTQYSFYWSWHSLITSSQTTSLYWSCLPYSIYPAILWLSELSFLQDSNLQSSLLIPLCSLGLFLSVILSQYHLLSERSSSLTCSFRILSSLSVWQQFHLAVPSKFFLVVFSSGSYCLSFSSFQWYSCSATFDTGRVVGQNKIKTLYSKTTSGWMTCSDFWYIVINIY